MRFLSLALPFGVALTASVAFAQAAPSDNEHPCRDAMNCGQQMGTDENPSGEATAPQTTSPEYTAPGQQGNAPTIRERDVEHERVIEQGKAGKDVKKGEQPKGAYAGTSAEQTGVRSRISNFLRQPGFAITAGGGLVGFSKKEARNVTSTGGTYTARLGIGTRTPLAVEVAYLGSAQDIDALGLDTRSALIGNGVEGALRINFLTGVWRPFIWGGAGWTHYTIARDRVNTSAIKESDDIAEFPLGAGIAFSFGKFLMEARGAYRFTSGSDMFDALPTSPNLNNWDATLHAGVEF